MKIFRREKPNTLRAILRGEISENENGKSVYDGIKVMRSEDEEREEKARACE